MIKKWLVSALNSCGLYTRAQKMKAIRDTAQERNRKLESLRSRHKRDLAEATSRARRIVREGTEAGVFDSPEAHGVGTVGIVVKLSVDPWMFFSDQGSREMVAEEIGFMVSEKIMNAHVVR